ncbi:MULTISPECIES: SGNH/GDSL hydrolase family protein [unclassified Corynebacterium]|uniref:SGNH/GDSL hydrolase family protein n=2 Tax=Corynebacterium TaxID=1716 RepID=UPI002648B324|nr:SGNH/GDSL hydrolase family protein [Corynebacterium sp.]MDN5582184.1 SGNH/GDSL hydrolase family protein [Corynebacterium sp.]MDN5718728.1 SGNH/GDSL hydrolase family protein [Corynebacterium sp.]MDN6325093.1 SGNH/GDSL hydrolase family protein [Corynebacterium sp.]MDN6386240.1 SGNH/GDSL hydrolase family protein [Corynebacterium sp.]
MRPPRRRPTSFAAITAPILALTIVFAAAPTAAADDLPASGSSGSLGSSATVAGSAGIPTLGTLFPRVNPYSEETENNLVAFGDSFTANSHWLINKYPQLGFAYPRQAGCFVAPDAWPAMVAKETGRPVQNWACNAHTTTEMLHRVDLAIQAGHVNDTSTVVLAAGMNDKRRGTSDEQIQANLVEAVEKVREAAPAAEILMLGRLSTTGTDEVYCDRNIIPNLPSGAPAPRTAEYERATQANQKAAAKTAGVSFVDIRDMTVDVNSTCARDADRFVSGLRDWTTRGFNMTAHPSTPGSRFLAEQIIAAFGEDGAAVLLDVIGEAGLDGEPGLSDVADEVAELLGDAGAADGASDGAIGGEAPTDSEQR